MSWKGNIAQKGLVIVCLSLIFEICVIALIGTVVTEAQAQFDKMSRSRQFAGKLNELGISSIQTSMLALIYAESGSEVMKKRYQESVDKLLHDYQSLKNMVRQDPEKLSRLAALEPRLLYLSSQLPEFLSRSRLTSVQELLDSTKGRSLAEQITAVGNSLRASMAEESRVQYTRIKMREEYYGRIGAIILGGLSLSALIAFLLYRDFKTTVSDRLLLVKENAMRIAAAAPLAPILSGYDEIAELDRSFHNADSQIRELERAKKELVLMIVSRLYKPLQAVSATTSAFLAENFGQLQDKTKDRLIGAQASVERLTRLIAQLQEGTSVLKQQQAFDLLQLVSSLTTDLELLASAKKIRFQIQENSCLVEGDLDAITQIIVNLLSNAIKFSPENGVVSITTSKRQNWISLFVSDQGPGIDELDQTKIFEQFAQIDVQDALDKGGSGLGLAICKQLAETQGGSIEVSSSLGQGSTFVLRLPSVGGAA